MIGVSRATILGASNLGGGGEYAVGSFDIRTTTGTQAITGLGFEPKAIIFWTSGSSAVSGSWNSHIYNTIGFTSGPTESYAVTGTSQDNTASSVTKRRIAAKAITLISVDSSTRAEADLTTFDTDGFTLNWTTATTEEHKIMFTAIGGPAVEAKVVNWVDKDGGVGNKSVTGVGFEPSVVLHAGSFISEGSGSIPTSTNDFVMSFGAMDASGGQWANCISSQDGQAVANTDRYQRTDRCYIAQYAGTIFHEAEFVSMDADGFTINYLVEGTSARRSISLCLSGVDAKVGSFNKTTTLDRIDTSTSATATAYSNQRKIDRCQNGVLWAAYNANPGSTSCAFVYYSTDDGATWNVPTAGNFYVPNGSGNPTDTYTRNLSFFIDVDDYAHVVFKDNSNGYIYYRRGTPNAARTEWTWSAALQVDTGTTLDFPDIIAHREGTGWKAHIVVSEANGSTYNYAYHYRIGITSAGVISKEASTYTLSSNYSNGNPTWPSIDFHHTGDGKTVKDSEPHLFVAWSAGATGSGKGIRFKKATYSGGSWTWGTEREIDPNGYVQNQNWWLNCIFNGTDILIGGMVNHSASPVDNTYTWVVSRDVADTTTTDLTYDLPDYVQAYQGTITYSNDAIYYIAYSRVETQNLGVVFKLPTGATVWEVVYSFDAPGGATSSYFTSKRGYSSNKIEFIYQNLTSNPDIKYASIDTTTGEVQSGVDQAITGVGFEPAAVMLSSATTSTTTVNASSYWGLGAATLEASRSTAQSDLDAADPTQADSIWNKDAITVVGSGLNILGQASLKSLDMDGYTLNWILNNVGAYEILYLALA